MKPTSFLVLAGACLFVSGCSQDITSLPGLSEGGRGAPCFHSGPPHLPLFFLHESHVAYAETIEVGRNVVHIGEDPLVDLIVLIGGPDASVDSCSVVYIHHDLVPGEQRYIVDGIWQCLNAKRHVLFQNRPKEQRYLRVPRFDDPLTLDFRLFGLDSFFADEIGVELSGGAVENEDGNTVCFLGERVVAIEDDPMVCHFRLLFPCEL